MQWHAYSGLHAVACMLLCVCASNALACTHCQNFTESVLSSHLYTGSCDQTQLFRLVQQGSLTC